MLALRVESFQFMLGFERSGVGLRIELTNEGLQVMFRLQNHRAFLRDNAGQVSSVVIMCPATANMF